MFLDIFKSTDALKQLMLLFCLRDHITTSNSINLEPIYSRIVYFPYWHKYSNLFYRVFVQDTLQISLIELESCICLYNFIMLLFLILLLFFLINRIYYIHGKMVLFRKSRNNKKLLVFGYYYLCEYYSNSPHIKRIIIIFII